MRIPRLLLVAIVVLLAARTAASQEISTPQKQKSQVTHARQDFVRPFVAKQNLPSSNDILSVRPAAKNSFQVDDLPEGTEVCLTLHTLQVAREDGTDSTHLVSQRTCTPSKQFEMKSAVVQTTGQK